MQPETDLPRMFPTRAPSIDALRAAPVHFRYAPNKRRVLVDAFTASAVLAIYDAASEPQRAKLARMVAGSFSGFERVVTFALARVKAT